MSKLHKTITLLCALAGVSAALTCAAYAGELGTATVNASSLNMRSGPSVTSSKISSISYGKEVDVNYGEGDWYNVDYNGKNGFVFADYLTFPEGGGAQTATVSASGSLNLRDGPGTAYSVITKIPGGTQVNILRTDGGWAYISYGSLNGYCSEEYLSTASQGESSSSGGGSAASPVGVVRASGGLNLRSDAVSSASRITVIPNGAKVSIVGSSGEWYQVEYGQYKGFVSAQYILTGAEAEEYAAANSSSAKAQEIIDYAKQYLGTRYKYGGASPSGFDCSGFTMYVFGKFGYSMPHSATAQSKLSYAVSISKSELKPGDLVFFSQGSSAIGHVGIYVGGGQFIHSSSPGDVVKYDSMSSSYYSSHYVCSRRILN